MPCNCKSKQADQSKVAKAQSAAETRAQLTKIREEQAKAQARANATK